MGDVTERPLRVLLSHTAELRRLPVGDPFVDAVQNAVIRAGHVPVDMAYWSAASYPPARMCREQVEAADVYLGVLGFRYGSPVRDHPGMSYTELEFDTAARAGKPLLIYLLDDTTEGDKDLLTDPEHGRAQEAFRRRVRDAGITVGTASTPKDLALVVFQSLRELTSATSGRSAALRVWGRMPPRNQVFTGRNDVLDDLRRSLQRAPQDPPESSPRRSGATSIVHALHGMGGIGKTALAIEYAHRHANDYDLVWWVSADNHEWVPASLAECAQALGLASAADSVGAAVARLATYLHDHDRWLIVYDNAEDPTALREHLLSGPGHVLITSRNPHWRGIADPIGLDLLAHDEAVALLQARATELSLGDAGRIAEALDHLPLALTQAGAYLAQTVTNPETYLELLRDRAGETTTRGDVHDYPVSIAASWGLAFDRLERDWPAALQLLTIGAHLAPNPIPFSLFTTQTALLPEPLATTAADPLEFVDLTGVLRTRALARVDTDTLQLHRLVQALLRDRHDHERAREAPEHTAAGSEGLAAHQETVATSLLLTGVPAAPWNAPETWPAWGRLLPHVQAVATSPRTHLDQATWLLDHAGSYLLTRGQPRAARPLLEQAYSAARAELGGEHATIVSIASTLASTVQELGHYDQARALHDEILTHHRHVLGMDHPNTLMAANNLVTALVALGRHEQARNLDRDTLERRRRVLGEDHPDTLASASNLANDLRRLGEPAQARVLHEDVVNRRRRLLGADNPATLFSAHNLALDFFELGEHELACTVLRDTLGRRRRVLGDDHPATLFSAANLAKILRTLGEHEEARTLDEDTLDRRRRVLGADHPETLGSAAALVSDLRSLGEQERADALEAQSRSHRHEQPELG